MRALLLAGLLLAACGPDRGQEADRRLVLFGPSLTETLFACGAGDIVAGVDRYSDWPPEAESLPDVGGYLDPNLEQVASLRPTSIHSVGSSPELAELARALGVPYRSWSFDTLDDALEAMSALGSAYGSGTAPSARIRATLDSLGRVTPPAVLSLVVSHTPGSGSVTLAGRETFLGGMVEAMGCSLAAPEAVAYPRVSLEGMLRLDPQLMVYLVPDRSRPADYAAQVRELWEGMGMEGSDVHVLTEDYLLVPGPRMGRTARRISECVRSSS
jgi:iron complex transport system substrate-binding protein